jgi:hypothetical protein
MEIKNRLKALNLKYNGASGLYVKLEGLLILDCHLSKDINR